MEEITSQNVFIRHGHNEEAKHITASSLSHLKGFLSCPLTKSDTPIILKILESCKS